MLSIVCLQGDAGSTRHGSEGWTWGELRPHGGALSPLWQEVPMAPTKERIRWQEQCPHRARDGTNHTPCLAGKVQFGS